MSATLATEMRVEYDEAIRQKPELFDAVQEAQAYFEENYPVPEGENLVGEPAVKWELLQNRHDFPVRQSFTEVTDSNPEPLTIHQSYSLSQLRDEVTRNYFVLSALRLILRVRHQRRAVVLESLLKQLDREEANGNNHG
jgi:hypothetical protein